MVLCFFVWKRGVSFRGYLSGETYGTWEVMNLKNVVDMIKFKHYH